MRQFYKNLLDTKWLQEVFIFLVLFVLTTLNAWHGIKNVEDLAKSVVYFLILYAHAQLHRFVLLPWLFGKRNYASYIACTVLLILLFSFILYITDWYWINYWVQSVKINRLEIYFYHTGTCMLSLIAMMAPFLMMHFYHQQKIQAATQASLDRMELKNLHAQLNPHFLFNTFNNLYGISLSEPSRIPDLILQVSKLMRYQVGSSGRERVLLEDELDFIESYIGLEEERVGARCDIRYEYENHSVGGPFFIAPQLLISFIENAFKHGTNSVAASFVEIKISIRSLELEMQVCNSIPKKMNPRATPTGTGLKNAAQRLAILYGDRHTLTIQPGPEKYTINLKLPLTLRQDA
jgi:LytS/YehU family sensor histidine kinase